MNAPLKLVPAGMVASASNMRRMSSLWGRSPATPWIARALAFRSPCEVVMVAFHPGGSFGADRGPVGDADGAQAVKVVMHPSMAGHYRDRVANLREALAREHCQSEAAEIMRTLIDRIVLTPLCRDGKETLSITCTATWRASSGLPRKQKGRSVGATLWWSAQNWLRGQDLDFVHFSWLRAWRPRDVNDRQEMLQPAPATPPLMVPRAVCRGESAANGCDGGPAYGGVWMSRATALDSACGSGFPCTNVFTAASCSARI